VRFVPWREAPKQRKGNGSQAAWESKQQSDLANWTRRASNGQRGKLENAKVNVIEKMEVGRVLYETFCKILRLKICGLVKLLAAEKEAERMKIHKLPPAIEDLRNHSDEQMLELRLLLNSGETGRADERRPGFFEMEGIHHVYYVFRYPSGHKVLLVAAWERASDPVAEMVAVACPAA
jgi:hypothetical protein